MSKLCYFCFLCAKIKYSRSDFTDVFTTFLDLGTFQLCCCLWSVRQLSDFIKNILICVLKMNEGLTGLE